MTPNDSESLRPEIPLELAEVGALLELARAFLPQFELPRFSATPPMPADSTAEVRVRKAEARYQALVEQIPAVTFMASFENGLSEIYVSPHIETLLGYTAREWIDDPILWYQRLHPDDKERWNKEFSRTVSWAEPFKADYRFLAKDGRVVWIHGEAKVVRDESGQPSFVQGIGYDITELKRAEEVLRRSHEELEEEVRTRTAELSAFKWALDEHAIVAITDSQGKITYANDKFCLISKYSREELLGQDHRIINSGHHPKEFIRDLWTTIAHGRVWHGEIKNRAKDGSYYWVDTTIVPFLNEQGKPRQYIAIRADITERKRVEEALRANMERTRLIIETALDAMVTIDAAGVITGWNPQAETIFGWASHEVLNRPLADTIIPERYRVGHQRGLAHYLATGEAAVLNRRIEITALRRDGHEFPVELAITPLRFGDSVYFSAFVRDITERKQAEEEIHKLNAELEQRVLERTAQLEAANKELEAFSYSVSHDLRAPLRAVDGFSQAVLEDYGQQLPAEGQRYLKTIRHGAQRMGILIDDLLSFSRLSRAPLNKQKVDTAVLVRNVLNDLSTQREGRQVDLRIGELPACKGDPSLLKQVWINLLSNAFKYTQKREVAVVEIGCERAEKNDVYFVRDNGTGFDMRYADKLFGVFQRLHRAEEFEGTGVGLAIVQRVVRRHGGRVWAEAEIGRGATFRFTLE